MFKARSKTALCSKLPELAPTHDFVLAPQAAQLWAEAGPFDATRKEARVDLIQYGLRGHAAGGLCKDVQHSFLDGGCSAALNSRLRGQSCLSIGFKADRFHRLIKVRGLTTKLV
jgi:hypothetical protein